jgi:hypothetical protein
MTLPIPVALIDRDWLPVAQVIADWAFYTVMGIAVIMWAVILARWVGEH